MHIWGLKHTLHVLSCLTHYCSHYKAESTVCAIQTEHWFHLQSGLSFFTHGAFIFDSTSWAMGQQLPVDVILQQLNNITSQLSFESLNSALHCQRQGDSSSCNPTFVSRKQEMQWCSFGGWCKQHYLPISPLQKQLAEEEACQCFRHVLFCFSCFDEIHL